MSSNLSLQPDFALLFKRGRSAETYAHGTQIFKEGDAGNQMYVVLKGEVEIRVGGKPVFTVKAGDIFGEMALIEKATRSASAVTIGQTEIVPVDEEAFLFLVQQTPYFALNVMRTLAARLREMDKRILGQM